jgi:biopolymer transport protein ExbD
MIKLKRRNKIDHGADITSLLDVVFILLIFFMLTAVTAPQGMAVNLPEAKTSSTQKDEPTVLSITSEAKIYLGKEQTSLEQLKDQLAEIKPETPIMIQGDKEIDYGFFVEVMDVVRQSGNHPLVLAAEVQSEEP